jgi:hypothetical protein
MGGAMAAAIPPTPGQSPSFHLLQTISAPHDAFYLSRQLRFLHNL